MFYSKISRKNGKIDNGCDVYVSKAYSGAGWNLNKSKWAIPAEISNLTGEEMQTLYEQHIIESALKDHIPELAYQKLGCWCKSEETCHALVLTKLLESYLKQIETKTESVAEDYPKMNVVKVPLFTAVKRTKRARKLLSKTASLTIESVGVSVTNKTRKVDIPLTLYDIIKSPMEVYRFCDEEPFNLTTEPIALPDPVVFKLDVDNRIEAIIKPMRRIKIPHSHYEIADNIKPVITKGFVKKLYMKDDPFICYVARISKNKTTQRYTLVLSESTSEKATNDDSVKVHLCNGLSDMILTNYLQKNSIVLIKCFTVTCLAPKKYVVFVTELERIA